MEVLHDIFTTHLHQVGMTYIEHLMTSCHLSKIFMMGSIKALIHAIIPFIFEKGSTQCVLTAACILDAHNRSSSF